MKPTPQVSPKGRHSRSDDRAPRHEQNCPATDYNFQSATDEQVKTAASRGSSFIKLDTFRNLSTEFLARETHRDYAVELALFALVTALSAWSIIDMMMAASGL